MTPAIQTLQTHLGCAATLEGHTDIVLTLDVLEVAAAGDGGGGARTLLLSGSKDNSMRLWEAPSGRCLGEHICRRFWRAAVRPRGCQLVAATLVCCMQQGAAGSQACIGGRQ